MNFEFSEDHKFFRERVSDLLKKLVLPHASRIDEEEGFPENLFKEFGRLGYFGIRYPEEIGGMNADCITFTIFAEELARVSMGFAAITTMQCLMGTEFIHSFGTKEQKERCLIPAIKGEKVGTIAFTEPNCGSDLGSIQTYAKKEGDGYILNGRKMWITNGAVADFVTVVASIDPSKRINGLAFFLVEKGTPGFSVGQKIEKISAKGANTAELIFDNCYLPKENLLGEEGKGVIYLEKILNEIRIMMAALGLGLAKSAFETGIRYAKEREAFGRPISKFQLIQEKIAEMDTKITNSQLLTYYTAWLKDQGRPHYKEAAMAKFYSTETASFVVDEVTRIHGAYGIAKEYNAQRYFRDARFLLFGGGTSEILKIIIARE
ncbi:MAG: acyl-CoA dehydrogenase family protein, partial [Deltaproteobacteria bacterium]|nr:acyl-CoA dehydrogenase family protein [Deltaproteobacteria bacterium]